MNKGSGSRGFPTTLQSQLLAIKSPDPTARARSFDVLTLAYYKPVYKYARLRWRKDEDEARELTHDFFATALEKGTFAAYDPTKARFRTFLRLCFDRFVAKSARAGKALKRGGAVRTIPLEFEDLERDLARSGISPGEAPDDYFDTEWVRHLLGSAVDALREECRARGKMEHFHAFEKYDLHADDATRPSYGDVARDLGIAVTDVTNRLAFARREFRRLVLDKLREITATDEEFRSEAFTVLGIRL